MAHHELLGMSHGSRGFGNLAARLLERARGSTQATEAHTQDRERQSKKPRGSHDFRQLVRRVKDQRLEDAAEGQEELPPRVRAIQDARARNPKVNQQLAVAVQDRGVRCFVVPLKDIGTLLQRELAQAASKGTAADACENEALTSCLFTNRQVMTSTAEASGLQMDRNTLSRLQADAACAVVMSSSYLLGAFFTRLLEYVNAGVYSLVMTAKKRCYDETPCRISIKHTEGPAERGSVVKLLQSEMYVAFLLKNERDGQLSFVKIWLPTPLTVLERNTASLIATAQRELEAMVPLLSDVAKHSKHAVTLINTDSYSANFTAENVLASEDSAVWAKSHYGCDVHRAHTICSKQYGLLNGHVSAMIYAALSVQHAGGAGQLRRALTEVLEEKLVLVCAVPPGDDSFERQRLQSLLDLFLGELPVADFAQMTKKRRRRVVQRQIIAHFLNGNTADEERIFHINPTFQLPRESVLAAMKWLLVPALVPGRPPILSRKSWTGAQEAVEWYGLLSSLHGLFEAMICRFTKQHQLVPVVPKRKEGGWANVAAGYMAASRQREQNGSADFEETDPIQRPKPQADPGKGNAEPEAAVPDQPADTADANWQEYNRQLRVRLASWARSKPGNCLIILRSAMEAPLILLNDLLKKAGVDWERGQQLHALENQGERTYVALEASRGASLEAFFKCLEHHFHANLGALSNSGKVRTLQVLMFRLLAVVGSCATHYLGLPWNSYPVKLFKACDGKLDLLREPACVLCPLSATIRESYPTAPDLQGPEAQAVLGSLLRLVTLDIARIEAVHSSNRRVVTAKSVQATRPNLERISAEFALRSNRLHQQQVFNLQPERLTRCKTHKPDDDKPKKIATWGWTWRAFLNDRCRQKFSASLFASLSQDYASLCDEERQRYEDLGKVSHWIICTLLSGCWLVCVVFVK